jgi:hypothetical protein
MRMQAAGCLGSLRPPRHQAACTCSDVQARSSSKLAAGPARALCSSIRSLYVRYTPFILHVCAGPASVFVCCMPYVAAVQPLSLRLPRLNAPYTRGLPTTLVGSLLALMFQNDLHG